MPNVEKMDKILEFISSKENQDDNFSCYSLKKRLFPELNPDLVKLLILEIHYENPYICHIEEPYPFANPIIYSNGATKSFLDSGGFTEIQKKRDLEIENEKARQDKKDKVLDLELNIKELQKDSLEYKRTIRNLEEELKISSLIKNYWWLIAASVALGITIGGFLV